MHGADADLSPAWADLRVIEFEGSESGRNLDQGRIRGWERVCAVGMRMYMLLLLLLLRPMGAATNRLLSPGLLRTISLT